MESGRCFCEIYWIEKENWGNHILASVRAAVSKLLNCYQLAFLSLYFFLFIFRDLMRKVVRKVAEKSEWNLVQLKLMETEYARFFHLQLSFCKCLISHEQWLDGYNNIKDHREVQVTAEEWIEKYWRALAKRGGSYKTPNCPQSFRLCKSFINSKI